MKKKIIPLAIIAYMLFLFVSAWKSTEDDHLGRYSDKDIFIRSYECGYIDKFPSNYIIITTAEQSDYIEKNYGMESNDNYLEMKTQFPISEYTYVILYESFGTGGYVRHVNKVEISGDGPYFVYDVNKSPRGGEGPAVMVGFMHMAAVPKEYLVDCDMSSRNIFFPGEKETR